MYSSSNKRQEEKRKNLESHNTKGHCHPRASSAKTRGFHTQLDEGPETLGGARCPSPWPEPGWSRG